jgi:isopenicillin N synthase-like dioxygenase
MTPERVNESMTDFPVIDLASGSESAIARELDGICRETGFLAVRGHGVASDLLDETWSATGAFFELPLEKKMCVAMPYRGYPYGYSPVERETLALSLGERTPPDLKETFSIGPRATWETSSSDLSRGFEGAATLWPEEPRELAGVLRRYFDEMGALAARLMSLFAVALELPRDFFEPAIDRHASALRALRYPPLAGSPHPGQLRAGAHTDYGSLTLLFGEPLSTGLEIRTREGQWRPVPMEGGAFVVNIGDLMARWSNDRWVSTLHRVSLEGASVPRRSIAFFHLPNWDAEIRTLPTCIPPGETARYPPIRAGAHLTAKFQKTSLEMPWMPQPKETT